jgi:drug/metabolite transporter (DMT)-like permease
MVPASSASDIERPTQARVVVYVGILCLVWGSTWFVIKDGLRDLPPLFSAAARFWLAAVVMLLLAPRIQRREGGPVPRAFVWITVGTLSFFASYGIVYVSETVLPSGLVSVLWAVYPLLVAVLGHFFLPGERLRAGHFVGFVLGFGGVVLLFRHDVHAFGSAGLAVALLLLVSPVVVAVGTVVTKRYASAASSAMLNRNGMFVGAVLLSAASALFERDAAVRLTSRALFSIGYLAIMGTVVTFGLYHFVLRHAPAHRLSLIAYVTPVLALTLGWALGGEPIYLSTVAGTALILGGVALVVR